MKSWSNLAQVVFRRTYARRDNGYTENYHQAVERVIAGNIRGHQVSEWEVDRLRHFMLNRKAGPAGRGYWFSGSPGHARLGGSALCNCWFTTSGEWANFVMAQDLLMLGGGVGMSVEHKFTDRLPKVKRGVSIFHKNTKDADFIVPDSREGWCELTRRVMESFFESGQGFCYSTVCVRGAGEPIIGFGGTASGPGPVVSFIEKLVSLLITREGKALRPIDAADILCSIAEMVVAGNVRRSALIIIGDPWDKDFLKAKRWDLGTIPSQRSNANFSVAASEVDDLHPLFWQTYEHGEPFGLINLDNIQKYGRMGEKKKDAAIGVNPCVPAGTEILTRKGYLPIDQLVGKKVEVWNGQEWSTVVPRVTGTNQPLVTVRLSSGQELTCTTAHQWVVSTDYRGGTKRVAASELDDGDKIAKFHYPILLEGEEYGHAYTQGFLSADGMDGYSHISVYAPKHCCISRLHGIVHKDVPDSQGRLNLWLNFEALPKIVPMDGNLNSRLNWFAGLLDGDGAVLKEGGIQIGSVNRAFLLRVQKMLTITGTASKVTLMREEGVRPLPDGHGGSAPFKCQTTWRLLVGAQAMQKLVAMGLHCERLDLSSIPNGDASRFPVVTEVMDAGVADTVYCFTEEKNHTGCFEGVVTGQCAEATLEDGEPCNLQEISLPNLDGPDEFEEAARLMHRWGKRVTMERYLYEKTRKVVERNRRVGTGITGCLESPQLFNPAVLDRVYAAVQEENVSYAKELGINPSIRTTVIKPSGTRSKMDDVLAEGVHCGWSRYGIQRIRFAANDPLIARLRAAGHYMEPVVKFDGTLDHGTLVVDFYVKCPAELPTADEGFDTWKQLDVLMMAQRHWADQAVSVTVYYQKAEIPEIKAWLALNLKSIKTISFLCHNDHGFKQAPKEAITKEQYFELSAKVSPIDVDGDVGEGLVDGLECASGACPVR